MRLELDNGVVPGSVDALAIEKALGRIGWDASETFAILTTDNGDYMQTACRPQGLILERRTLSPEHHFRALRAGVAPAEPKKRPWWSFPAAEDDPRELFTREEVAAAFNAFVARAPDPAFLEWENMDPEMGLERW